MTAIGQLPVGGDLTGSTRNAQIAAGAVGTAELASGAVTNAKVAAAAAIANTKLAGVMPVINPKDAAYGVVADGATDDTTAWTAVFAAVPSSGAIIVAPVGVSLVPNGGLSCANPVHLLGAGVLSQDQSKGSVLKMTASTGTLLSLTSNGTTVEGMCFMHPSSGTRSSGLVGLSLATGPNFARVHRNIFSGFSTLLKVAAGIYWNITENAFRDFILKGVDATFSVAGPDGGDGLIAHNTFDRTAADIANGVTGGAAIYLHDTGGTRMMGNKINAPSGASGFDYGVQFDASAAAISTIVSVVGGSIEGCKTAGVAFTGSNTASIYSAIVKDVEISGLNGTATTGVLANNPGIRGLDIDAHIKDADSAVDLTNVKHGSVRVNGTNLRVAGVRLRTLCRDVKISPDSTFDGPVGVQAVVFDNAGKSLRANQEYETWIPFDFITDSSAHDMFEIGVNSFCQVFVEVDITGVNQGVGGFAHRLRRVANGNGGSGDGTVSSALPDEYTGTGSLTSTFLVSGLGGAMRYQITRATGTSTGGMLRVRVFGQGLSYFKQSARDD